MTTAIVNVPDWRVTLDGDEVGARSSDLTAAMAPRLVSLTLSERRDDEADQLDIILDDTDGNLAIPKEGAVLQVWLGWVAGTGVQPGLVAKGRYRVDHVSHSGPPDQVRIRARAADFTGEMRNRREQSWRDVTLGAVLTEIAGRNGLTPRIASNLASITLPAVSQNRESDVAFMRRLGAEHDAVATIKDRSLIFTGKGSGRTAGGAELPRLQLTRSDGDNHLWERQKRDAQKGVTASWHDRGSAKRKLVHAGEKIGAKRLRKIYPDEASAKRAAQAERSRLQRSPATLSLRLALGRPDAFPEVRVQVSGFKPEIDAATWLITEVRHTLDAVGGFATDLKMETAP